ncbi:hypothetical protein J3Q64DRAFT_1752522 [Phycomyces blakesleeanus]|uniref:CUE domain-containing protein n=2 Tax=Phycomyces blakesleeanus TaxID=4837 RepID=A0A162U723_PHYB8|nr:hypothetical protein PHYBLDRAFT_65159 [Phycomyces blakesleeanus NRRL 1555(-)]OAD72913.1 hypothetical protein PHYBLDRAFT_65159 [Phycomyces blakesleeanus NRRL 1555(-)]|eukprot:XP_018290953.1 hypothetical protein PHYBLDRAFT_65159 [Phycomyces blakesleeanus NRRL 1555(-)]
MQAAVATGFYNVLVTKALILWIGGCSVVAAIFQQKMLLHLQLRPHLTVHHQFWRLLTSHCAFTNSGDLFYGMLLLYAMQVVERNFGSAKYAAFVFVALGLTSLLEVGALVLGKALGLKRIPGGPYALLFAMLYQYHRIVPVVYRLRVFGLSLNNKMIIYLLAVEMAFSQGIDTLAPAVCGLLVGMLYRSDVGHIKQWRFHRSFKSFAVQWLRPWLASAPIARSTMTMPVQQTSAGFAVDRLVSAAGLRNRQPQSTATTTEANSVRAYLDTLTGSAAVESNLAPLSEEHVALLSNMFPEHPPETVERALAAANNDVSRAVEIMLSTPAPEGSNTH